ncbi:hypothetical protein [Granulicella tundricola]|uniref:Glycosyltransferase RgtA/B/C/D-like domain-containing protein n=1 Tax=Granulicella tundricola (strain ATCC BAA-1859 / DSM 23138 / MP5ACTX9) TaxID=1198114 RepID=E8X5X0_GRATM|nr:hypothetical protein [Granulicella tundricola]ADW70854.1 hypothetical protein AciX9_4070 [Granulicella tundricola MP5ACTX9]
MSTPTSANSKYGVSRRDASKAQRWLDVLLLFAIPGYLFINLFTLHGVPHLIVSDDGLFVLDSLRMGEGLRIYRDFFQFNAPGIDYIFRIAFGLFGIHTWVPALVNLVLGTSLSYVALYLCRRLMPRRWAILTTALFVVFIYGRWLDATHHWFSLLAILLAIVILIPGRSPLRAVIAGGLIGIAAFFTQTAGTAAWLAFSISLFYERVPLPSARAMLRRQASLLVSGILVWFLLSASTLMHVGWRTVWYFQVVFPRGYELRVDTNPLLTLGHVFPRSLSFVQWENVLFYLILVCTTPIAVYLLWTSRLRNKSCSADQQMAAALLASSGLLLMAEVVARATWIRLYADFLPSMILFFAAIAYLLQRRPALSRLVLLALWSVTIISGIRQTRFNHATHIDIASLPTGWIALSPQDGEEFRTLAKLTHPGDLFFQAFGVDLYLPLGVRSPVYMDYLRQSSVTRPEFLANAISALRNNHVHYVILRPVSEITFDPTQGHVLDPLYTWIETHYMLAQHFSNGDQLWELQP